MLNENIKRGRKLKGLFAAGAGRQAQRGPSNGIKMGTRVIRSRF